MNYSYLKDNLSTKDYQEAMSYFGIETVESFWPGVSTSTSENFSRGNGHSEGDGGSDYAGYYCESRKNLL